MGNKEKLQKEIERLERYARFYQNILLAILSGIVWSIYAILEKKVSNDIILLTGIGLIIAIFVSFKIKSIDKHQDRLLKDLKKEK